MRRLSQILMLCLLASCANPEAETSLVQQTDHKEILDSTAIGNVRFGIRKQDFINGLNKMPEETRMSEPRFNETVCEIETPVTIGTYNYRGFYYFDKNDRLYKVHLMYQNEERLVRNDYNGAYENLCKHFETLYGTGTAMNTMPGLKMVTWTLRNKKIELSGSCLASNCTMECTITETNLFHHNTVKYKLSEAGMHLRLKQDPLHK